MNFGDSPIHEKEKVMHSIHLRDMHVPKGPNLWLTAMSAVYIFAVSLVLFLIFSMMGGTEFTESMGGDKGLWFLIGGLLVSVIFASVEKQKD
jgi:hypothetical protein